MLRPEEAGHEPPRRRREGRRGERVARARPELRELGERLVGRLGVLEELPEAHLRRTRY